MPDRFHIFFIHLAHERLSLTGAGDQSGVLQLLKMMRNSGSGQVQASTGHRESLFNALTAVLSLFFSSALFQLALTINQPKQLEPVLIR